MTRGSASGGSVSMGFCLQGGLSTGGWADLPPRWDTMGYSQQGGGTHPTGMHSCCP